MSFDIAASIRRLKPQKKTGPLDRRDDGDLLFAERVDVVGPSLMLDSTVYIDVLQDRLPDSVADLLRVRQIHHSSVAVAELSHALGRLDPRHPLTAKVCKTVQGVIADIPLHRLHPPSVEVMAEAGILTGIYARLQKCAPHEQQPLLNDAQLFLQSLAEGCYLLTRNIGDMDRLQQLHPAGRLLFYRHRV